MRALQYQHCRQCFDRFSVLCCHSCSLVMSAMRIVAAMLACRVSACSLLAALIDAVAIQRSCVCRRRSLLML